MRYNQTNIMLYVNYIPTKQHMNSLWECVCVCVCKYIYTYTYTYIYIHYCIGTWNIVSVNQGKLVVVK